MDNLEKKNTVSSKNQVSKYIFFNGDENGSPRVMFLGNSITKHAPAPQIGWHGNWGMAASSEDQDYVHICMRHIRNKYPDACACIVQAAAWEREYREIDIERFFFEAKHFKPDIIITRLSENVPDEYLEHDSFINSMRELHQFLSGNCKNAKLIVTSNLFGSKVKDQALKDYSEKFGAVYVYLNDYKDNEENFANDYENEGVRVHPGDKGMKFIADRIICEIDKII